MQGSLIKRVYRSGFVSIIGRPNVGKSTFLNRIVGGKKQRSYRINLRPHAIRSAPSLPMKNIRLYLLIRRGGSISQHRLGDYMVRSARSTLNEVEVVLFLVEAHYPPGRGDIYISRWLKDVDTPVFLVLNKKDCISPARCEEHLVLYRELYAFDGEYMISALHGENIDPLLKDIIGYMPEGPRYYPPDMITDRPQYFLVSELIREKCCS